MNIRKEKKKFKKKNNISGNVVTKVYRNIIGHVISITFFRGEVFEKAPIENMFYLKHYRKSLAMKIWEENFLNTLRNHVTESMRNQFNIQAFEPRHIIVDHSMNL